MSDGEDYLYSDEDEGYAYSEDEEDGGAGECAEEPRFRVPDAAYRMVDYQEVLPIMQHLTLEVSSLLGISPDMSLCLLQQFQWNKEKLVENFFSNSDTMLENAGLAVESKPTNPESFRRNFCRICLSECQPNDLFSLSCNHKFCTGCYTGYLNSAIDDGPICVTVTCPEHECCQRVLSETVKALCTPEIYDKFMMYMTRNFIETSTTMRWCPAAGCDQVAIGSGITTTRCSCSYSFCFRCGGESHDPASCKQIELWQEKCQSESETANWILANTKKCPKCSARIEKNQGCNHMTCKVCKYDFCWICCGDWKEHGQATGGYYKCNRYESNTGTGDAENAVAKAKAELDRYLHYYQRYHNHDLALKFAAAQREKAEEKMVAMQASGQGAWIDVQFVKQAVEQVIECRRILKYTYVLGHYLLDKTREKELFEHHQEMLEKHTERLSELTEKDVLADSADRAHVVNLTRITEKFVNSMLSVMMEGQGTFSFTQMQSTKA